MSKRMYSLEAAEKVMLDSDSNSEPEIDEEKVEKHLQKERKKEISKKCLEKSISSGFGRDAGLSVPGFGLEVEPSCFGFSRGSRGSCSGFGRGTASQQSKPSGDHRDWHKLDKNDVITHSPIPEFWENVGFQGNIDLDIRKPNDIVELFLSDEVWLLVVNETNKYAKQFLIQNEHIPKQKSRYREWKAVTVPEMKAYFALRFTMEPVQKHEIEDYWSTFWLTETPGFTKIIPRNRFELIPSFLHYSNNNLHNNNNNRPIQGIIPQTLRERHWLDKTDSRKECVVCSNRNNDVRIRTSFVCRQYVVALCVYPCSEQYHTLKDCKI